MLKFFPNFSNMAFRMYSIIMFFFLSSFLTSGDWPRRSSETGISLMVALAVLGRELVTLGGKAMLPVRTSYAIFDISDMFAIDI